MDDRFLKSEEATALALRSLYRQYGYLPYKMSKFEEYDLYVRNKDFLVSDRIITFNDTDGKLLALKPDITLSIIKNSGDADCGKQKVCYDEAVYRVSSSTQHFKELTQVGLENIGEIDLYDLYEVICLAAESLRMISPQFVLDVSHLDLLSALLNSLSVSREFQRQALSFISEKNAHDFLRLCREKKVEEASAAALASLFTASGTRSEMLHRLKSISCLAESAALAEWEALSAMLDRTPYSENIRFDFSVVNDFSYYNGVAFRGFVDGVCDGVLSGGCYDRLMQKMGRDCGAIGFALYLDRLEQLQKTAKTTDVDVLLLYDDASDRVAVAEKTRALIAEGKTVSAQRSAGKLRAGEILRF